MKKRTTQEIDQAVKAYLEVSPGARDTDLCKELRLNHSTVRNSRERIKGAGVKKSPKQYSRIDLSAVPSRPATVTAFVIKGDPQSVAQTLAGMHQ